MPRHDRAYGEHHETSQKGGNTGRKTRTPKNTYAGKQNRRPIAELLPAAMGRNDGNSNQGRPKPQTPKPQPKGGSKPSGTVRRRTRLSEATA